MAKIWQVTISCDKKDCKDPYNKLGKFQSIFHSSRGAGGCFIDARREGWFICKGACHLECPTCYIERKEKSK